MHSDCSAGHDQAPSPGTRDRLIPLKIMDISVWGKDVELEGEC